MTPDVHPGRPPRVLLLPAVVGIAFLALPTLGLLIRAPWSSLASRYADSDVLDALRVSLVTATEATGVCLVIGLPMAALLARGRMPGLSLVRAVVTLPLVLPPVVGGVALLLTFGRNGYVGRYLSSWFGIELPFTQPGIVLAQAFVAMPFFVVTVEGALRGSDLALEEAAASLGASPWRVFARVTTPLVLPSIVAGAILSWARALGEFGATVIFGGNHPGVTRTLPTAVVTAFESDPESAIALSLPLLLVAVLVVAGLRDQWLRPGASA
jgi:molybdate transport system permease protein